MILAAGLTPAWQQVLVFGRFRYGRVNRADSVYRCASGKVCNAGIAIHRLGGPSQTLAPVGGPVAAAMQQDFDAMGVPCRWIATRSGTRICTTILDQSTGDMTELVENGSPLDAEELESFRMAFAQEVRRASVAIVIGSLPEGTPSAYYRELVASARCPVVLDFRGEGLLSCLDCEPLLVKPNRDELAQTVGRPLASEADVLDAMRTLVARGAHWVLVSHGEEPILLASAERAYRVGPLAAKKVVNPIGCGDALASGIAWATRAGRSMPDAVRLGVSAAAANLRQLLPCHFDAESAHRHVDEVTIEPVDF